MWDVETLEYQEKHGVFGSLYSSGNYIGGVIFHKKGVECRLDEFYGVVSLKVTKRSHPCFIKRYRVISSDDLNTLKSCAINNGYKVDWFEFMLAYKLLSNCESAGYPLVQDLSYRTETKVTKFAKI